MALSKRDEKAIKPTVDFASGVIKDLQARLAAAEARAAKMEAALLYVSVQLPEYIGGENYLISPGACYRIRAALAPPPTAGGE